MRGDAGKEGLTFPREARLVRRGEFDAVYRAGKRRSSSHFTVFFRANELPQSRFGVSIKKALGGNSLARKNTVKWELERRFPKSCVAIGLRSPRDGTS